MKKTTWEQADVFPVIAEVIREMHGRSGQPVAADKIAEGLLNRVDGQSLVNAAHSLQVKQRTHEWLAGNMVAWFGIRTGKSDWGPEFEYAKRKFRGHTGRRTAD